MGISKQVFIHKFALSIRSFSRDTQSLGDEGKIICDIERENMWLIEVGKIHLKNSLY